MDGREPRSEAMRDANARGSSAGSGDRHQTTAEGRVGRSLALARAGDLNAAAALLAEVGGAIRTEIHARIPTRFRSALDADDVMQVSYLEALLLFEEGAFTGAGVGALRVWVKTIASHNLADAIRGLSRKKRPNPTRQQEARGDSDRHRRSQFAEDVLTDLLTRTRSPSQVAAAAEAETLLLRAIETLPFDYATVIRLYDLDGGDIDQVAATIGRSVGAVHMLRLRARERLRAELGRAAQYFTEADD